MKDIRNNKFFRKLIIIIILLAVWEIASVSISTFGEMNSEVYFPSFSMTVKTLFSLIQTGGYWNSVFLSLLRVISGYLIAVILGLILAVICSFNKFLSDFFSFLMSIISATPVVSFILIALILIRVDYLPVFIGFLMIMPIVFGNITEGIVNLDRKLIEVAKVYKIKGSKYLFRILIPSLRPYISAALLSSFGLGWKATISAEVLARPDAGIGSMLYDSKVYLDTPELFAYTLTVILLSYIFEMLIKYFSTKLTLREKGAEVK